MSCTLTGLITALLLSPSSVAKGEHVAVMALADAGRAGAAACSDGRV